KVEKIYGERRLQRFAADIGIAACTLERARSVYRRWKPEDGKSAPAPISYSVAQELQAHPDRRKLVEANPKMTKQEARKHRHALEDAACAAHTRRWFAGVVERARKALSDAGIADQVVGREQQHAMRAVIDRTQLQTVRDAGNAYLRLALFLGGLLE